VAAKSINMRTIPLAVIVILLSAAANGQERVTIAPDQPRKKVIAWGGIDWYSPAKVRDNIREIEKLPFDGMVLQGFVARKNGKDVQFDWESFGKQRFERSQLEQTVATLKQIEFRNFTDNFLRYNTSPGDVDWFDDFSSILHNARLWASIAKDVGAKGWMFDVEDYKGTNFNFQKMKYRNVKSFDEYTQQVHLRGREFMQAVQTANPDIVILLALAHSYVNRTPNANRRLSEIEYGLLPAFINGMIAVAGARVRIIDGHEQGYGYLTSEEFFRGYHATRRRALTLVPSELHGRYRTKMECGMAVYANYSLGLTEYPGHWPIHYLTAEERIRVFEQNVYSGLQSTDEYLWIYNEHIGWWEKPGWAYRPPAGTLAAIRSARDKVNKGRPLGFRVSPDRIHRMRSTLKIANPFPSRSSTVPRVRRGQSLTLDGNLNDSIWQTVPRLREFSPLQSQPNDDPTITESKAAFDDEHLYLAFRCVVEDVRLLHAKGAQKDDNEVSNGECIEVSIRRGERQLPFRFIVNPRNVRWDGQGDFSDWNGRWLSAAQISQKEWTAEVAIPWTTLGGRVFADRSLRTFFCRRHAPNGVVTGVVQELSGMGPNTEPSVTNTTTLDVAEDADITNWVNWRSAPRGTLTQGADGGRGGTLRVARGDFPGTYQENDGWILLKWNLASIPAEHSIDKVTLRLVQLDTATHNVNVFGIDEGRWTEANVTWDNWQTTAKTTRLGTMKSVSSRRGGVTTFSSRSLTDLVQHWHTNRRVNHGLLLKWAGPSKNGDTFAARESRTTDPARLIIEHSPKEGTKRSALTPVPPPGVVITHYPASSGIYVGSPSIAILPGGDLLAAHDGFGPQHRFSRTYLFRSSDQGAGWRCIAELDGQGTSTLFTHSGAVYLFGLGSGSVQIRRSNDGGHTWSEPHNGENGRLLTDGPYHTAPTPVVVHGGRIWRAMERVEPPGRWGRDYRPFVMSAAVDSDLLRAASWTSSDELATDTSWLNREFKGWLEGNAVVAPNRTIANILRVDSTSMSGGRAAMIRISQDGAAASLDPAADFLNFPGGSKKFTIRFDSVSERYWSLTNWIPPQTKLVHRIGGPTNPNAIRNNLTLVSSPDLKSWSIHSIVLTHPDMTTHGFQYVDWQFNNTDLIAVCRTAFDDDSGGAHSAHDANYLTFHRIKDFRKTARGHSLLQEKRDK